MIFLKFCKNIEDINKFTITILWFTTLSLYVKYDVNCTNCLSTFKYYS